MPSLETLLKRGVSWIAARKPLLPLVGIGGLLALALTVFHLIGDHHATGAWLPTLDRSVFDIAQRLSGREGPDGIVIVGTDRLAGRRAEAGRGTVEEELPLGTLGEFIRQARSAGASAFVLDVRLPERLSPGADSILSDLLAGSDDIVLTARTNPVEGPEGSLIPAQEPRLPPPGLAERAAGVGLVSHPVDPDSVIRRARVRDHLLGIPYWSVAVEAVRVHLQVPWQDLQMAGDELRFGARGVGTGREYYIDHRRIRPPLALGNLMRGGRLPRRVHPLFADAVVLVTDAGPNEDVVATPLHASVPRIFVEASEIATLLHGTIRHPVPLMLDLLLLWVIALTAAPLFSHGSLRTAALVWGAGLILLPLSYLALFNSGTVVSPSGPLIAWTLLFPATAAYRIHLSHLGVVSRDRSIEALGRLREVQFDGARLVETLTPVLETLASALDARSVLLLQKGNGFWEVVGGVGAPPGDWSVVHRAVSEATEGDPLIESGGRQAVVPILVDHDERQRVLYVQGARNLGPLDLHTLLSVASGLHLGFHNRALTRSLEQAYLGILTTISVAVEARDRSTEAHCQRMATYSCAMARELSHDEDSIRDLWVGAMLHDIGKIGIPDAVLLKPGKLTRSEYQTMKQHTVLGYEILENAPISHVAKLCVLHHHERWDGAGYPHGLEGEEIPAAARIVALIDMFDALTSDRVYRPAKPEEEALELIEDEASGAFDPDLVACFQELHRKGVVRGAGRPIPETTQALWESTGIAPRSIASPSASVLLEQAGA